MRDADERQCQGIETLKQRRRCVNGDLIRRREQHVLLVPVHRARAGTIAGKCAVHHREEAGVDVLLDREQIDQCLVDDAVRPVALAPEQTAERVLHRAGNRRKDVRLHRGQLDDVVADEEFRDIDALWINIAQNKERLLGFVAHPGHFRLVDVGAGDAVLVGDITVLVVGFAVARVHDHRIVVNAEEIIVPIGLELADDALQLPRRR